MVITRFAPSNTGFLHIGGARTALFNYLFARHHGGQFKLRIEDTDQERNNPEAVDAIFDGLAWLGITHDGKAVFQSTRADRHREIVRAMLANGTAYKCYMSGDDVAAQKAENRKTGAAFRGRHRDNILQNALRNQMARSVVAFDVHKAFDTPYVVRLRAPSDGQTVIADAVQGSVTVQNHTLDDMVLLRSDGSPTYMLAVVVDDHDAGVTHVIRGDDHLNNAFRQVQIIRAMGWPEPQYAHIPLIHGEDGKKFSKRHGAAAVTEYADMGILSDAMINYLAKLGWGHGDDEIISREQMIEWFDLSAVNRGPARFDMKKLMSLNEHYLRSMDDGALFHEIAPMLSVYDDPTVSEILRKAIPSLKPRCSTIAQMADMARFYVERPTVAQPVDLMVFATLGAMNNWTAGVIEAALRQIAETSGAKLKNIVAPIRMAITGSNVSPPLFEAMELLGRDEIIARMDLAHRASFDQ